VAPKDLDSLSSWKNNFNSWLARWVCITAEKNHQLETDQVGTGLSEQFVDDSMTTNSTIIHKSAMCEPTLRAAQTFTSTQPVHFNSKKKTPEIVLGLMSGRARQLDIQDSV
jgi:hypothetical protein